MQNSAKLEKLKELQRKKEAEVRGLQSRIEEEERRLKVEEEGDVTFWAYHPREKSLFQVENEEDAVGLLDIPKWAGLIIFKAYMSTTVDHQGGQGFLSHSSKIGVTMDTTTVHLFDRSNPNWSPEQEYNSMFIRGVFDHLQHLLRSRGHLFINDVYDVLHLPRTSYGAIAGWMSTSADSLDYALWEPNSDGSRALTLKGHQVIFHLI